MPTREDISVRPFCLAFEGWGRRIVYTDFQDGKENVIGVSADWPRPWQIYEIEILKVNALVEIWEASKRYQADVR